MFLNLGFILSDKKGFNDKNMNFPFQGKKIDFNEEIEYDNENKNNQNLENTDIKNIQSSQNNIINNNNLNNSNALINQSNINLMDNNIEYINQRNKITNNSNINIQPSNINLNMNMNMNMNINVNKPSNTKVKCTCSKTGCLKKYCACFSLRRPCEGCDCKNCQNQPNKENINISEKDIENINYNIQLPNNKNQRVICNCTKSNCMKKYCECYKQGLICNSLCRCLECKNKNNINNYNNLKNNCNKNNYNFSEKNNNLINNNINNLSQVHDFSTSYLPETFGKPMDYDNPINYQPEAFGIFIKKEKLIFDERIIDLNKSILNKLNKEIAFTNFNNINETPKYSNRKRARSKNDIANMKTCPTTNSSKRRKKGLSSVNKNIQKKKLQLN